MSGTTRPSGCSRSTYLSFHLVLEASFGKRMLWLSSSYQQVRLPLYNRIELAGILLPTLAIFEEKNLALVQSTILYCYCIWLVSPLVLLSFPMSFFLDLFRDAPFISSFQSSSLRLPALAEPKWRVKPPRADGYTIPSACSKEHGVRNSALLCLVAARFSLIQFPKSSRASH